jgi:hypothetical protein
MFAIALFSNVDRVGWHVFFKEIIFWLGKCKSKLLTTHFKSQEKKQKTNWQ